MKNPYNQNVKDPDQESNTEQERYKSFYEPLYRNPYYDKMGLVGKRSTSGMELDLHPKNSKFGQRADMNALRLYFVQRLKKLMKMPKTEQKKDEKEEELIRTAMLSKYLAMM